MTAFSKIGLWGLQPYTILTIWDLTEANGGLDLRKAECIVIACFCIAAGWMLCCGLISHINDQHQTLERFVTG